MQDERKGNTEILTLTLLRVRFTQENCSIFTAHEDDKLWADQITCKMFQGPVRMGQRWLVIGSWKQDEKWGRQFVGTFATLAQPRNFEELASFLTSGLVDGWDWSALSRLRDAFGDDACTVIEQEAHRLTSEAAITEDQMESLTEMWSRGAGLVPIYAKLTDWGIGAALAERLVKHYRFNTVEEIEANPYAPIREIAYYTWKVAEEVAIHLEVDDADPRRIEAGVAEVIRTEALERGHTWMTYPAAVQAAQDKLGLDSDQIIAILAAVETAMDEAEESAILVRSGENLYPGNLWWAEQFIAAQVGRRLEGMPLTDRVAVEALTPNPDLSDEQWAAVVMALTNPVSLLTGGPGTGKTTVLKSLVTAARELGVGVTLMAPTGKAAQRMKQVTGCDASTIHRKLKLSPGQLHVGVDAPVLTGLVIADEISMCDTALLSALLSGISAKAHVLLVGDPDQLPSVGPGAVLRDLLETDLCTRVHLTHVYRNDAGIAINAAHIRAGEYIQSLPDCRLMQAARAEQAQQMVISLLMQELPAQGYGPDDVLVLCPTNDGESGRHALNTRLQCLFNGGQTGMGITQKTDGAAYELRPGDKVIVTKNNSDLGVFNGETGRILTVVAPKKITADIDGREVVFNGADMKMLQLAYAITGHKAQGSEAPVVIVPVFFSRVLSREWIYTVLTRARKQVYLVGDPAAIQGCIRVISVTERRTGLVAALRHTVGKSTPAERPASPFAWSAGSDVFHTRRATMPHRTLCGIDATGEDWNQAGIGNARPCLRCQATHGTVVKPFPVRELAFV